MLPVSLLLLVHIILAHPVQGLVVHPLLCVLLRRPPLVQPGPLARLVRSSPGVRLASVKGSGGIGVRTLQSSTLHKGLSGIEGLLASPLHL